MLKDIFSKMIQDKGVTSDYEIGVYRASLKDLRERIMPEDCEGQANGLAARLKIVLSKRHSKSQYFLVIQSGVKSEDFIISIHTSLPAALRRGRYEIRQAYKFQKANGMPSTEVVRTRTKSRQQTKSRSQGRARV